jgi:thiol-disulfide isomerase/thioredoxin
MKSIVIILLLISFPLIARTKDEIIQKFLGALKANDIIQYTLDYSFNDASKGTNSYHVKCAEMIIPSDTANGGYYNFKIDSNEQITIYSGKEHFSYFPGYYGYGNVELLTKKKNPERFSDRPIEFDGHKGYIPSVVKASSFNSTSIAFLRRFVTDKENWSDFSIMSDTNINGHDCYRLNFLYHLLAIDKKNYMPVYFSRQSTEQQTEAYYSDYKFNAPNSKNLFSKKAFPKNFKFSSELKSIDLTLKAGTEAPDFEITSINDKKIKLSELKGKMVFMYVTEIGCPPCMIALPDINEFAKDYKEIIFLGIYPLDSKKALLKLSQERDLIFDIFHKAKEIGKSYGIQGYPTFFIIDKSGTICYSTVGYSKQFKETLKKELEKAFEIQDN